MPKIKLHNLGREEIGDVELSDEIFGATVNEALFYEVVKAQMASKRIGSANTKNRAEVVGSSRKVYKQKGTGNARHGTIRAPIYVGGGQAHGPKPRSYAYRPPRKMRIGALRSALSYKLNQGCLLIVDDFQLAEIKTRKLAEIFKTLQVGTSAIVVDDKDNDNLRLSIRNLPKHQFLPPEGVNLYDLLRHEHLVLTQKVVAVLEARCQM